MKTGERYWSLVDPIWEVVSIYDGPDAFLRQFSKSDITARSLLAAHWCQSEVRNGGFHQFFSNPTGVLAPEAGEAFNRIGMPGTAAAVAKAMAWFGDAYPRDGSVRRELLLVHAEANPEAWDPFGSLDDLMFDLLDEENGGFDVAADVFAEAKHG